MKNASLRFPYALVCVVLGLALGWIPFVLHGPIPAKFDRFLINGSMAVWTFYTARLLIGFLVGITSWPSKWYVRGPLCGILMLFPPGFFLLATPGCGST